MLVFLTFDFLFRIMIQMIVHGFPLLIYADKEVEGYYEDGMRVPDYVTLLWTDDKYVNPA